MISTYRIFVAALFGFAGLIAAGCGSGEYAPAAPSDVTQARQTLMTALDTWAAGSTSDTLAKQKPHLYVGDEDWSGGHRLKKYELLNDGERFGNSVRFQVGLELAAKGGEPLRKKARYVVATNPVQSVTRDDRAAE